LYYNLNDFEFQEIFYKAVPGDQIFPVSKHKQQANKQNTQKKTKKSTAAATQMMEMEKEEVSERTSGKETSVE